MESTLTHSAPFALPRAACRPLSAPAAPRGHYSHTGNPDSLATLASLSLDPLQPRHVRRFHRAALETSLAQLATLVRSISAAETSPSFYETELTRAAALYEMGEYADAEQVRACAEMDQERAFKKLLDSVRA